MDLGLPHESAMHMCARTHIHHIHMKKFHFLGAHTTLQWTRVFFTIEALLFCVSFLKTKQNIHVVLHSAWGVETTLNFISQILVKM